MAIYGLYMKRIIGYKTPGIFRNSEESEFPEDEIAKDCVM